MLGAYIRVSSETQRDNDSVANQTARANAVAIKLNSKISFYYDVLSGGKVTRKEWVRLKDDIATGQIKIVWANENDRLGRNVAEAHAFLDILIKYNCRLFIGNAEVDPNDDNDWLKYGFDSLISEADRRKIRKKTKETKALVINDGRNTFRQLYGYDCKIIGAKRNRPLREWFPVESETKTIKRIYKLYLDEKVSLLKIAQMLNDEGSRTKNGGYWHTRTLYHVLHHIEYTGNTRNKAGEIIPSKVYTTEIVSLSDYNRVQELYPSQTTQTSFRIGRPPSHPASGILKCRFCNTGYFFHAQKKFHTYYHNNPVNCDKQTNLVVSYLAINFIFEKVFIYAMRTNPLEIYETLSKQLTLHQSITLTDVNHLTTQIGDIAIKIDRLIKLYEKTEEGNIVDRINEYRKEKKALEETLLKQQLAIKYEKEKMNQIVAAFSHLKQIEYIESTPSEKRRILRSIIDNATIGNGTIEIRLIDGRELSFNYEEEKRQARRVRFELKKKFDSIDAMDDSENMRPLLWLLETTQISIQEARLNIQAGKEEESLDDMVALSEALTKKIAGENISIEMEKVVEDILSAMIKELKQNHNKNEHHRVDLKTDSQR